tara:strand:- start:2517 stop:2804 length:288 start_codon:yes stop_codon:yes gene_type:complete
MTRLARHYTQRMDYRAGELTVESVPTLRCAGCGCGPYDTLSMSSDGVCIECALGPAEELQREEPQRNWLFILTWLVGFPVIVAGEIALAVWWTFT